jgi:hypothetical protein
MHSRKNRAREMARKSVAARQKAKAEALGRLTIESPKNAEDLVRELLAAFTELRNGTLDENRARALATIGNSILKGFELTDVRRQLAEIERILTERT